MEVYFDKRVANRSDWFQHRFAGFILCFRTGISVLVDHESNTSIRLTSELDLEDTMIQDSHLSAPLAVWLYRHSKELLRPSEIEELLEAFLNKDVRVEFYVYRSFRAIAARTIWISNKSGKFRIEPHPFHDDEENERNKIEWREVDPTSQEFKSLFTKALFNQALFDLGDQFWIDTSFINSRTLFPFNTSQSIIKTSINKKTWYYHGNYLACFNGGMVLVYNYTTREMYVLEENDAPEVEQTFNLEYEDRVNEIVKPTKVITQQGSTILNIWPLVETLEMYINE